MWEKAKPNFGLAFFCVKERCNVRGQKKSRSNFERLF
jgi:hypothetical protein